MNIADLRQEYMRAGLSEAQADADPIRQFERWFEDALRAKLPLPNAMTLATVTPEGAPSARIVLLKGVEQGAFLFYTNYLSRKGRELEQRAQACLVLLWSDLERQVRIDGVVQKVTAADSDAYYATRPLGARLSAWASAQSATVATRKILEDSMEKARRQHGDQPPRPANWGGYRVVPHEIEFWQGRADRLHDRLRYRRTGETWAIERVSP
jgi:pyridoxamine 5'-phosphate oxidase